MANDINPKYLDVRTVEKNIERGLLTREQYNAWLASLPDDARAAAPTDTRMVRVHARPVESVEETIA